MRNRARIPLSKAKVRQSWSKYNLYNLSRVTTPPYKSRTFFQQKWDAKSLLRAYHSEQVSEGVWERMFSRRLRSVVPMDPRYLAANDGSLESAGRGSGLEKAGFKERPRAIPYMQMTFAPLERRLDTAIFRALFASSARQARQFVVHGAVKVNGQKMQHPGYLLNPGDMFQVDPERVMFATGAPKESTNTSSPVEQEDLLAESQEDTAASENQAEEATREGEDEQEEQEKEAQQDPRKVLKSLLAQAKSVLENPKGEKLTARRKQDLRGFQKQVKRQLSRSQSSTIMSDSLEAQFRELKNQLTRQPNQLPSEQASSEDTKPRQSTKQTQSTDGPSENPPPETSKPTTREREEAEGEEKPKGEDAELSFTDLDLETIHDALSRLHRNPIDPSKPYATPWEPRPYMSAFVFIPRYLEVNQNICAAVYLRHPVARPGLSEVPSPFSDTTASNAFAWYLKRR